MLKNTFCKDDNDLIGRCLQVIKKVVDSKHELYNVIVISIRRLSWQV